ncbi:RBBP9/YdeN family alpha/beta hydrolase [Lutibaculum baratangense]|uniref:Putative esterase of the alpha/beta hydrolase n=1 Tax=Lutibaculum baratangense AMV1 TaxID=631454 RepID=V4T760_9HYPH|nr:alpha/beta hydrolase [Lutibaculum baratangense]ESR22453.1 putative esterase of the alpha/beta hydrolase [Lutibaculum baratangense AMV1]
MRISDTDILIIPGYSNSGPEHWQTRWEEKIRTARRVEQEDWERPEVETWAARIIEAVEAAERPVVLIAHSAGVAAVAHAAARHPLDKVKGAFLVGLPDVEADEKVPEAVKVFSPLPTDPLPFPSMMIASEDDPYCRRVRAEDFAAAWGSDFYSAGTAGHFNTESGHGPWPEGLMMFARFMQRLPAR